MNLIIDLYLLTQALMALKSPPAITSGVTSSTAISENLQEVEQRV